MQTNLPRGAAVAAALAGLAGASLAGPALAPAALRAQVPAPSVELGIGVDTTSPDVRAVVRLVRAYLAGPDSTTGARGLWSRADSLDRRVGDLAAPFAYQGFPATVVGVLSAGPGDSVYVVRLLHATANATGRRVAPLALQRLYAVRAPAAPYGWQIAGALPRLTRDWERRTVGRVTYHYAPGERPDPARAAAGARFVDSVAALFAVPAPNRVDYYVTASPDDYLRALGLDFYVQAGPAPWRGGQGGRSRLGDGLLLAGDPTQGEAYRHELVHTVLNGQIGGGRFVNEGAATWLGGSQGRPPAVLWADLAALQRDYPALTLAALIGGRSPAAGAAALSDAEYASGALVVDGVFRRSGAAGLRALRAAPAAVPAMLRYVSLQLGLSPDDPGALDRWWRESALARSGGDARPMTGR